MNIARKGNRQLNRRGTQASNAGFSLVELLIAVTILAIIVIPLLHMFVTSTRINVKSRQTLRATTVAQDIMEGLKAYTLEEVRTQFTPADGVSTGSFFYPSDGFYILNSSLIQGGVREIAELGPDTSGEEIYYFGIENLKMQGGEYDALIRLDASTYGARSIEGAVTSGAPTDASSHDRELNGAFYAEIGSVAEANGGGEATDSSYHEDQNLSKDVLKHIKEQIEDYITSTGGTVPADLANKKLEDLITNRTIEVIFEDAASADVSGNPECKATITFTYTCVYDCNGDGSITDDEKFTSHGYPGGLSGEVKNITRTFSSGNFYLFYYPIYALGEVDNIVFELKDASKLFDADEPMLKSITLAKQIRSIVDPAAGIIAPELSESELFAKEGSYKAKLDIHTDGLGTMNNDLLLRTNIDTNMSEQAKHVDPDTGKVERDEINSVHKAFDAQVSSHINSSAMSGDHVSGKITNVIYDIEISVYETGAAQYFGDPNFESNSEVHRLAKITSLD